MKKLITLIAIISLSVGLQAQITIAEARALPPGTIVTVKGIAINGSELGNIRYMQDETAGIAAYSPTINTVLRGDSILVTGTLKDYNNLLEIDPVSSFTVLSSNNSIPEPQIITPSEVGEVYEAELVSIENALIAGANGSFTGNTNYTISANGETTVIRVGNGNPLVGTSIPTNAFTLIAIVSQFSSSNPNTGYQLLPRDTEDIIPNGGISIVTALKATVIETNSITLSWQTDSIGSTEIFYGLTPNLELGHLNYNTQAIDHQITIPTEPGTLIYVNAFSVDGTDTAFSRTNVFISKSLSSGEIKVYFNQEVDVSVATESNAIPLINQFTDTTIAYINRAQQTIDMMMYDNDCRAIIDALNMAHDRGVQIRFITDAPSQSETQDTVLNNLNPEIAFLAGNTEAIMHNKILIFDRDDVNKCQIITGSTNHTLANLNIDYNNMVIIQDQSLIKAYMLEFYEMWGSTSMIPNPNNAKFGSQKSDNTPHQINVGGKYVELYFSPSDHTASKINNALMSANHELEFGVMAFTEDLLGNTVKNLHNLGVNVRGIIDYVEYSGSEFQMLLDNGVQVLDYQNPDGSVWPEGATFHSKYAIVDSNYPDSDPLVINGSHNWTAAADNKNDENTLIIHDAAIANLFLQEFTQSFNNLLTPKPQNDIVSTQSGIETRIEYATNDFIHNQISSTNTTISEQPKHGSASVMNNQIIYVSENNYVGIDSLKYRICNATMPELCGHAWIIITVIPNIELIANNDLVNIELHLVKNEVNIDLFANDIIPEGYDFTFEIVGQSSFGICSYNVANTIFNYNSIYMPSDHFIDTMYYRIYLNQFPTIADTALVEIKVDVISGINDQKYNTRLALYPNPTNNHVEITTGITGEATIELYSLTGKLISSEINDNNNGILQLNCENLPTGIYMIKVKINDEIRTGKLVKK